MRCPKGMEQEGEGALYIGKNSLIFTTVDLSILESTTFRQDPVKKADVVIP